MKHQKEGVHNMTKARKNTTASFNEGFGPMFEDIRKARPDLKSQSEIAQVAVRKLWENLKTGDEPSSTMGP
jgi:hypothetical protein